MASFFEKLKKGMQNDISIEEDEEELEIEDEDIKEELLEEPLEEEPTEKEKPKKTKRASLSRSSSKKKKILVSTNEKELEQPEGELAVDVYQTEDELVIQSPIAGVKPESLDVSIEEDQLTIKGFREKPREKKERSYFYQECYWGPFSRQILLPEEVDPSRAQATLKEGILTIRIPKLEKKRKIIVKG